MAGTGISFAGNSLQTANILTADIKHETLPAKNMAMLALAHQNKSAIPFVSYPSRSISISGTLVGSSVVSTDNLVDTFKGYLLNQDQNLDIDYAGGTRRYIATANTVSITRPGNLNYATFEIEFICTLPFGQDTAATTILNQTGRTAAGYTDSVTFGGTAPYQLPVTTITLTAVSASGSQSLTVGNNANGQAITVTRSTWAAGDVVVIDSTNNTVTVNGVNTSFTGAFAEFAPGAQALAYSDTFTSRTFSITVTYTKAYL